MSEITGLCPAGPPYRRHLVEVRSPTAHTTGPRRVAEPPPGEPERGDDGRGRGEQAHPPHSCTDDQSAPARGGLSQRSVRPSPAASARRRACRSGVKARRASPKLPAAHTSSGRSRKGERLPAAVIEVVTAGASTAPSDRPNCALLKVDGQDLPFLEFAPQALGTQVPGLVVERGGRPKLKDKGAIVRGFLGVQIQPLMKEIATRVGLE